jgi:hypothetical protein
LFDTQPQKKKEVLNLPIAKIEAKFTIPQSTQTLLPSPKPTTMMRTMILASTVAIGQAYNHADQALRFQGVSASMKAPGAAPTVDPSTQYV